jgi:hypothetical protein
LASVLREPDLVRGRNVLVIVSGGNVDPGVFKQSLDLDESPLAA